MSKLNPLQQTWMVMSTIFGAIGLVSVTEDIHKWAPFFVEMIDYYKTIWYWPFDWFPFFVPEWMKDYLFFAGILFSSLVRQMIYDARFRDGFDSAVDGAGIIFIASIVWPITISWYSGEYLIYSFFRKRLSRIGFDERDKEDFELLMLFIGSTFIVFFVFLTTSIVIGNGGDD